MSYLPPPRSRHARGIARPLWILAAALAVLTMPFAVNILGLGIADVSLTWLLVGAIALAAVGGVVNHALDRLGD